MRAARAPLTFETLQDDHHGYDQLSVRLKEAAGISLPRNSKNLALLAGRLLPTLQARGLASFREYETFLSTASQQELNHFVVQLTTNTTHFFREDGHFKLLALELHKRLVGPNALRELRVWCAAASTGQEPFTILMTVLDVVRDRAIPVRFLATDIDTDALKKAAAAEYTLDEIASVPPELARITFVRSALSPDTHVVVRKRLREMITFAPFNLMTDTYPFQHPFDVIFCRNVMIYFEPDTAHDVLARMCKVLKPGGLLFVGHAETGLVRDLDVKACGPAAYVRGTQK